MTENITYCVCAPITMENTHKDSLVGSCVKCGAPLFYMPHNIAYKKICMECFKKMPSGKLYVKREDVLTAEEMLKELKKEKGPE